MIVKDLIQKLNTLLVEGKIREDAILVVPKQDDSPSMLSVWRPIESVQYTCKSGFNGERIPQEVFINPEEWK